MALHLPSYVQDTGLPLTVGMTALALIGFGNIFGSYGAGWLGQRIKTMTGISCAIDVVMPDTIERTLVGKAKRVVDQRKR